MKTQNGFTLIEVLLAIALAVGLVSLAIGSWYLSVTKSRQATEILTDARQLSLTESLLRRDIRNSWGYQSDRVPQTLSSVPTWVPPLAFQCREEEHDPKKWSRLTFLSAGVPSNGQEFLNSDLMEVEYFVDFTETKHPMLVRRWDDTPDNTPDGGGEREILLKNVEEFHVEVFTHHQWTPRWQGTTLTPLPDAVRVVISTLNTSEPLEIYEIPLLKRDW